MFNKKYCFFLVFACSAVLAFKTVDQDYPNKESLLMDVVLQSLAYNHYTEAKIDDSLSVRAYNIYLKRVDNGKRFFLQKDIDSFEKHIDVVNKTLLDIGASKKKIILVFNKIDKKNIMENLKLAELLLSILKNEKSYDRNIKNGLKNVKNYSWDYLVSEIIKIYKKSN